MGTRASRLEYRFSERTVLKETEAW